MMHSSVHAYLNLSRVHNQILTFSDTIQEPRVLIRDLAHSLRFRPQPFSPNHPIESMALKEMTPSQLSSSLGEVGEGLATLELGILDDT